MLQNVLCGDPVYPYGHSSNHMLYDVLCGDPMYLQT